LVKYLSLKAGLKHFFVGKAAVYLAN